MARHLVLFCTATLPLALAAQRVVPVGTGANTTVVDMAIWNDQLVVVGGTAMDLFDVDGFGVQAWDGTQVFSFPSVFTGSFGYRQVEALNGELYISGRIQSLGQVARWDGVAWVGLDQGLPESVNSLVVFEGALHAATLAGLVCRWSGTVWDTLGGRFNEDVVDLAVHEGVLYAGGDFTANSAGEPVARLARWTGSSWQQVGTGVDGNIDDLASTADGLALGGLFDADGSGAPLPGWAIWSGSNYTLPALDPLPPFTPSNNLHRLAVLPDGSYVVNGVRIRGDEAFDLDYEPTGAVTFGGRVFLGGISAGGFTGHGRRNQFSELVDGRHHTVVDAGAMRATVSPTPALFERHWLDLHGLEVPKGEGKHSIYSASPWVAGKQDAVWKRSLPAYNTTNNDSLLWAGPQQAIVRDDAFYARYHQVWTVDQAMIDAHAAQWNDPNYALPYAIATWPGNGNTANGEPARIAPFQDQDGDGLYEPEAGDHPLIRGHRAAYTILRTDRTGFNENDVECDMHLMVYNYDDPALEDRYNSTFVNLRLINRSGADYDSVLVGLFTDLDLGNPTNDLTGCDSTRNLWYGYNGTELDADTMFASSLVRGYGTQPPAIGVRVLNHPLHAHSTWQPDDSEPIVTQEFIDVMDGTPGDAPHVGPSFSSRYQFPGGDWTDTYDAADVVADRRSVGSTGPFFWAADDTLCVDLAVMHARATSGGAFASVAALQQRADAVQALYDALLYTCNTFRNVVSVEETESAAWRAYPNPTTDQVTLTGPTPQTDLRVELLDAMGRTISSGLWPAGTTTHMVDLTAVEEGAYVVVLRSVERQHVVRVIKGW